MAFFYNVSGVLRTVTRITNQVLKLVEKQTVYTITTNTGGSATVATHASPAYCVLDVLLNKSYGLGRELTAADIDLQSFYDAYEIEQDVSSAQKGTYVTSCRGIIEGARSAKEMIDMLLLVGHSNLTTLNGLITYIPNQYLGTDASTKATAVTFSESNIIGGIHTITFAPSNKVYNKVTATVPVTNSKSTELYSLTITDANALAEDNGRPSELVLAIDMAAVELDDDGEPQDSSKEIVEEICRFALRRSRLQIKGSFKVNYWDYPTLACGNVIEISSKRFNLEDDDTILAKITRIVLNSDGQEAVHWQQYSNLIYDVSQSDITSASRGSVPEDAFNAPITFDVSGADGASISIVASSGTNPGDVSTITVVSTDPNVDDQVVEIQPGKAGADADTGLVIYRNVNAQPDTPTGGALTDGAVTTVPTDWTANEVDNGGVTNRWGSRTSVDNEGTAQVEKIVPSGITPAIVVGTKEQGYFDVSGTPGNDGGAPESMTSTFNNVTGETTTTAPIAQVVTTTSTGTTGSSAGSSLVDEEGFFDVDGVLVDTNDATRDSLDVTFSVGSETSYTFEEALGGRNQSYTINLGFSFPVTSSANGFDIDGYFGITRGGFSIDGFNWINESGTSNREDELVSDGSTMFYYNTTATSNSELASDIATAYNALAITGEGTTTVNEPTASNSDTHEISRAVVATVDGDSIKFTYLQSGTSVGTLTSITTSGVNSSTFSNESSIATPSLGGATIDLTTITNLNYDVATQTGPVLYLQGSAMRWFLVDFNVAGGIQFGTTSESNIRKDELTFDGNYLRFISSTATTGAELAAQLGTVLSALTVSSIGATTINHAFLDNNTTAEVSRGSDVSQDSGVLTLEWLEPGNRSTIGAVNGPTLTLQSYVPEPGVEYWEIDVRLSSFPLASSSDDYMRISGTTRVTVGSGTADRGQVYFGSDDEAEVQGLTQDGGKLYYYSDDATSDSNFASSFVTAFNTLGVTGVGTTSVPSTNTGGSAVDCSRSTVATVDGGTIRFTNLVSDATGFVGFNNYNGSESYFLVKVFGVAVPFRTYTTSDIADKIASDGYTGVTLTHDNTFDTTNNPLTGTRERIKFVYDQQINHTDVVAGSFTVIDGATGNLTVPLFDTVNDGGGVAHVADRVRIQNVTNGSISFAQADLANTISGTTLDTAIVAIWDVFGNFTSTVPTTGTIVSTEDTAGDFADPVLIHTTGTGSTAAIAATVTTDGEDEVTTGTLTSWTAVVNGVTYTRDYSSAATNLLQASEPASYLNAQSGISASSSSNVLTVTSDSNGNVTNFTFSITLDGTDQTATLPTVVPTNGSGGGVKDSLTLELISGTVRTYDFISGLTAAEVANTLEAQGYTGLSIVRDDTFYSAVYLDSGDARIVFTYNNTGNNTNVTASNFTVTAGNTGGTLEIKNILVTTEGVADTGITNFSIALDNDISVANLTGSFDSVSDKAAQSAKLAESLNTLGVLASGVTASVDGSNEVIVTNKATGDRATINVTYSGTLGTSVNPTITITTTGVDPGNNTPVWGTPFLDLARAITSIIFPVYQATSNNSVSVAGQIFPHGSAVMFVNNAYVYVGAVTLTTTTSTTIPSSDTTNWKVMT